MAELHKHMIVSGKIKYPLYDINQLERWFERLVAAIEMNVLIPPKVVYCDTSDNEGLTGIVCIDTSHAAIHIWNEIETSFFKFDLYSCKEFDPDTIITFLKELDPYYVSYDVYDRSVNIKLLDRKHLQIIPIFTLLSKEERDLYNSNFTSVEQKATIKKYNQLAYLFDVNTINRNNTRKNNKTIDAVRNRCNKKGVEFDLTDEWFTSEFDKAKKQWPELIRHSTKSTFWRANIDKIDPLKGYTQNNCRIIPEALNTAKSNYNKDELKMLVSMIKEELDNITKESMQ